MAFLYFLQNGKRGKCGDKVYQKRNGKYISYDYFIPANPRTSAQVKVREDFAHSSVIFRYLSNNYPDFFTLNTKKNTSYAMLFHENKEFIESLDGTRQSLLLPKNNSYPLSCRRTSIGGNSIYVNFVPSKEFDRNIASNISRVTLFFNKAGEVVDIQNISTLPAYTSYSSGGNRSTAYFIVVFFSYVQEGKLYRSNACSCPFIDGL